MELFDRRYAYIDSFEKFKLPNMIGEDKKTRIAIRNIPQEARKLLDNKRISFNGSIYEAYDGGYTVTKDVAPLIKKAVKSREVRNLFHFLKENEHCKIKTPELGNLLQEEIKIDNDTLQFHYLNDILQKECFFKLVGKWKKATVDEILYEEAMINVGIAKISYSFQRDINLALKFHHS